MLNATKGHWIFAAIFFIVFVAAMIWSYRKDKRLIEIYYKGGGKKILLSIVIIWLLLFIFVKMKQ